MQLGETAWVCDVLSDELLNTLLEMGFVPGAAVHCKLRAPLGGPVCVCVSGCDIALRREEASMITISDKGEADEATAEGTFSR